MVRNDSAPSGDGPHAAAPGARRRRLLLGLLALAWLWPLALPIVDRADTVGYIAPALSLVRDGDLLYLDEYDALRMHPRYHRPTPTGLVGNHWNVGLGLALVPSFALGTVLSSGDGMLDEGVLAASQATALLWAALLLWVLLALLRPLPLGWRVGLAAALYAGTPLAFYVHAQGLRPHLLEALGVSVFVWGWLEQRARPTWRAGLLLGLLAAGLALVRTQAALVLLLPAVELGWRLLRRRAGWWRLAGPVAATVVLALGGWLLQRQVTLLLYGAGNTGSLLRALGDVEWHLLDALTHPHHGLLPWSPVVLPALVGLIPLIRRDPALGLGAAALFSVQLVLNGTNFDQALDAYHGTRHWAGGGSFGARKFLNLLPILALGLGALASACGGRRSRILLAVWCGLAALWSLALVGLSRLDPHAVCEAAQSWATLTGGVAPAAAGPGDVARAWLGGLPSVRAGLAGIVTAVVFALAIGALVHLWRRLGPAGRARGAVTATASVIVLCVVCGATVGSRTRAARIARFDDLARFAERSVESRQRLRWDMHLEQARVRLATGARREALERYRLACLAGIGSDALASYLTLAAELEGAGGVSTRLGELERRHPGNPVVRRVAARLRSP